MFGFKSGKRVRVRKATTRIINESFDCTSAMNAHYEIDDNREDSRSKRRLPVFIVPMEDSPLPSGAHSVVGIADDVSCFGIGVLVSEVIPPDEKYFVCFETENGIVGLSATCLRQSPLGLGTHRCGFEFIDVLSAADTNRAMKRIKTESSVSA